MELAALVPGLEPIDCALGSVDGRRRQHRWLELEHPVVDEAQLDYEERQELQLMIHK